LVVGIAVYTLAHRWREARQEQAIAANADAIFRSPASVVAGNPRGDVSVVTFFDHNCPYCRDGAPDLAKLIAKDSNVRLVMKELPVLGPDSEKVARVALAAARQGKYFELYERMFAEPGRTTEAKAMRIAAALGLDAERLERDKLDPAIDAALAEHKRLAKALGVRGVPFYLVGDRPAGDGGKDLYGALAADVADIHAKGCRADC
jgi:protein-disulfide isomerase